jgi:hypothetical protein
MPDEGVTMMNRMRKSDWRASLLTALALVTVSWALAVMLANSASAQPALGAPQGPPPEALAACNSLASDAACSFSGRRGTVSGTCFAPQQGMALACRPKDAPPPPDAAGSAPKR